MDLDEKARFYFRYIDELFSRNTILYDYCKTYCYLNKDLLCMKKVMNDLITYVDELMRRYDPELEEMELLKYCFIGKNQVDRIRTISDLIEVSQSEFPEERAKAKENEYLGKMKLLKTNAEMDERIEDLNRRMWKMEAYQELLNKLKHLFK